MGQPNNIAFAIRDTAIKFSDHPAVIASDVTLSYSKLWQIVEVFAARMRELGIDRSSLVAVHTSDMIVSVASLLASALLGARYVVASKVWFEQSPFEPTHFLRSPEICKFDSVPFVVMDQSWSPKFMDASSVASKFKGFDKVTDRWLYLHSSGTTGQAKYMSLSAKIVFDRSVAVADQFQGPKTKLCSLYLCQSRPFFARAMGALLHGSAIVDSTDHAFLSKAGTTLICGSPRHAAVFTEGMGDSIGFADFEVSGSKLGPNIARNLLANFARVTEVYGAGETSKSYAQTVTSVVGDEIKKRAQITDSEVQIIDEGECICGIGITGTVRVKNPYMVSGYLGNEAATNDSFRDGWFYPGDIGHWTDNGELVIEGRSNEVINLRGYKLHPKLVDELLEAKDGVTASACFKSPIVERDDEMMIFLELEQGQDFDSLVNGCHQACIEGFGAVAAPAQIFVVPHIPRTEDGSVKRHACQVMALQLIRGV